MSMDDLKDYCCFNRQYVDVIGGELNSLDQLYNATKLCFDNRNMSYSEHMRLIFKMVYKEGSVFQNYTEEDCLPTSPSHIGYMSLWLSLLVVTLISNLTVIMAVIKISYLRDNIGNFFIASLAVTDVLVGVIIIPIKVKFTYNNLNFYSTILCRFYLTIDNALFSTSVTTLFFISIDRYLALAFPYKYQRWLTILRCKCIITGVWIYGLMWGLLSNINWSNYKKPSMYINRHNNCVINEDNSYVTVVYVLVFYIPALIMAIVYMRVLSIAQFHARSISLSIPAHRIEDTANSDNDAKTETTRLKLKEKVRRSKRNEPNSNDRTKRTNMRALEYRKMTLKASKTVATVYGTFFICWFPVSIFALAQSYGMDLFVDFSESTRKWFFHVFVEVLPVLNSTINPLIYAIMNRQYRKAYKSLFSRIDIFGLQFSFEKQKKSGTLDSMTQPTLDSTNPHNNVTRCTEKK